MNKSNPLFRTKNVNDGSSKKLRQCLTAFDLTLLGIGAIIGAGIFVLTGIAAATKAGPAVILSYALAGTACAFSALCYAELAAAIGGCGSAYSYAYSGLGEIFAWIVGWDLLLEYGLACSAVAIGWSGYLINIFQALGISLPGYLTKTPFEHGLANIPAMLVIVLVMLILCLGVKESARFNAVMVFTKLAAILLFIIVAFGHFNLKLWHPFFPFGIQGIAGGAALIFFAYIGFDAVSTAAEEALDPQRTLPIGIILSLTICTIIYMVVAGLLTGIVPYYTLNVSSPVADAMLQLGHKAVAGFISVGAISGLTTVILVVYYGFTRVFLAMARDGLLPKSLAEVNAKTQTPVRIIVGVGLLMMLAAGFLPMQRVAELVNIGTLMAFLVVCVGVIILRSSHPNLARPFKVPACPWFPLCGAFLCVYLMMSLPAITWACFGVWTGIGLAIYSLYGRNHSDLNQ